MSIKDRHDYVPACPECGEPTDDGGLCGVCKDWWDKGPIWVDEGPCPACDGSGLDEGEQRACPMCHGKEGKK